MTISLPTTGTDSTGRSAPGASLSAAELFGTNLVAMATPMKPGDESIDDASVVRLVEHLVASGVDGIVVAGTTGEAATLDRDEMVGLVRAVRAAASGRARIVAGVGTNDTRSSIALARGAADAGADALLVVAPYYTKPSQAGLIAHCRAVADATDLPVMLYDVPVRTGIEFGDAALVALADHPRIRAVKDAKGDLFAATTVMARTGLAYYCGIDELNLPYLAAGATGLVSVTGHVVGDRHAALLGAVRRGDLATARAIGIETLDLTAAVMRTAGGAVMAKAALVARGVIDHPTVRMPLAEATPDQLATLDRALAALAPVAAA